ncbi:MAG TPA: L-histidine N(alpha)-methyltransferase [Gammaproteobacteria bacterium]|nr:L-histidine N(alpha)-methyltransferase [Gammaproteobacteria bacterium]
MQTSLLIDNEHRRFTCQRVRPERLLPGLADDARMGLLTRPRQLPPKYFYDSFGSTLFDRICATPEYYVTRTEDALLAACAGTIIKASRPDHILELGSGASRKTHHLLEACETYGVHCTYWPFDVCEPMLRQAAARLMKAYPRLNINALIGDYHAGFKYLPNPAGRQLFAFLGSTIGNFDPLQAIGLLRELHAKMRPFDRLLLGADRVKDPAVLHAAYNDTAGLTAAFNLNVLRVLNRELNANFDLRAFDHYAHYNAVERQMEMYLIARSAQTVHLRALNEILKLEAGERILTEISRKFTPKALSTLLHDAGFRAQAHYASDNGYFSLVLATAA